MNTPLRFLLLLLLLLSFACTEDELKDPFDSQLEEILLDVSRAGSIEEFILPLGDDYSSIPQDSKNPITIEKVQLGKLLFFETGTALAPIHQIGMESYSCGSCHVPASGFLPGRPQGIADGGVGFGVQGEERNKYPFYEEDELDVQGIRPMTQINVAFSTNTTWSGQFGAGGVNEGTESLWDSNPLTEVNYLGFTGIESQNMEGIDLHRMVYNEEVLSGLGYIPMFDAAFEDVPQEERYSKHTAALAISAYTRTIIPYEAPFQKWLRGDKDAMTETEMKGAILFFSKAGCVNCHQGAALNATKFEAIGVDDLYQNGGFNTDAADPKNLGRGGFTGEEEDMFKFRVPQLYNLRDAGFYFHGASKTSLREVVEYFNKAIPENENVPSTQISTYFRPLHLSTEEVDQITAFLQNALFDPDMDRYIPEAVLSGNCIPNNDPFSQIDLGCD